MLYFTISSIALCVWIWTLYLINKKWFNRLSIPTLMVFIITILGSAVSSIGTPRHVRLQTIFMNFTDSVKVEVLAFNLNSGVAIYLWVKLDSTNEPLYLVFPWNVELASKLTQMQQDGNGQPMEIELNNIISELFEHSDNTESSLKYILPEAPPNKLGQ